VEILDCRSAGVTSVTAHAATTQHNEFRFRDEAPEGFKGTHIMLIKILAGGAIVLFFV